MNPISNEMLATLLANDGQYVHTHESKIIEFKSIWDWNNKEFLAKIAKTIAGMCNADGGYIFFGIDDKTKEIKGVSDFDKIDGSTLTSYLNNYFSPSINTQKRSIDVAGKSIGVIYIDRYNDIPSVCIKSYSDKLIDSAIYYRYAAMTEQIRGTELINLLHQLKSSESPQAVEDRKRSLLPIIEFYPPIYELNHVRIQCRNKGQSGFIEAIISSCGNFNFHSDRYNTWVDNNDTFHIYGTPIVREGILYNRPGSFSIKHFDQINTYYMLNVSFGNGSISVDDLYELED